jgi:membrane glycosyltransferase
VLFLPKVLALILITAKRRSRRFGGVCRLAASILLEILVSALLAPIRMWFHARFVLLTLLRRPIKWAPQRRSDTETDWPEAIRDHGPATVFAAFWILGLFWIDHAASWWALPVAVPLLLSAPLSVYTSSVRLGRGLKKLGILLIPEELDPPDIVKRLHAVLPNRQAYRVNGFVFAALDRAALAVHGSLLRGKSPKSPPAVERNRELLEKALTAGPKSLSAAERARLLKDVDSMAALHVGLARLGESPLWGKVGHG